MKTSTLVRYLDEYLRVSEVPDTAKNGLQVQGAESVDKLAVAVDACMETFVGASLEEAQMLLVHHGIFWNEIELLVGYHYKRVKCLLDNNLNLYAVHLPLDLHPEVGNNVQLARLLDLEVVGPFGDYKGVAIGIEAKAPKPMWVKDFANLVTDRLRITVRVDAFGPEKIQRVGIVTGGGASLISQAVAAGFDGFITGEPRHSLYHYGKETQINLIFAGHYATETLGVKALAKHLENEFKLATTFIDRPTGL